VRDPWRSGKIKNIAKGFRATSRDQLENPLFGGNTYNEQLAAYLVHQGQNPSASDSAEVKRLHPVIRRIWEQWRSMEGGNAPLSRSYAGRRDFDINLDGVAHYGLLPDFLQDLKNVGLTQGDLAPLFRSAEDYIRMWETCESRRPVAVEVYVGLGSDVRASPIVGPGITPATPASTLDLGTLQVGETRDVSLLLKNVGAGRLEVLRAILGGAFRAFGGAKPKNTTIDFSTSPTGFDDTRIVLNFSPSDPGTYVGSVTVETSADNAPTFAIDLRATVTGSEIDDTVAPNGTVIINGGASSTRHRKVRLTLRANDPSPGSGVASMRLSNDGKRWSAWQPYSNTTSWTLSAGGGRKTVHVQFRDRAGNLSAIARDSIMHRQ
jgi:hypothetical protein